MSRHSNTIPTISLFTGAGGLDLGFHQAGFDIRVAVECDPNAIRTLTTNNPHLTGRVVTRRLEDVPTAELLELAALTPSEELGAVIGGPPCQPFCTAGPALGLSDPRSNSLFDFCRVVREAQPRVFVMENIPGLLRNSNIPSLIRAALAPNGQSASEYNITWDVLDAAEYGVPQRRRRLFFVGWRGTGDFYFPAPTHGPSDSPFARSTNPALTVGEALAGLPPPAPPSQRAIRVAQTIPKRNATWYGKT